MKMMRVAILVIALASAGYDSASAQSLVRTTNKVTCSVPPAATSYKGMAGFITVVCPLVPYSFNLNSRYPEYGFFDKRRGQQFSCFYDQQLAQPDVKGSSPHSALDCNA